MFLDLVIKCSSEASYEVMEKGIDCCIDEFMDFGIEWDTGYPPV